VTQGLAGNAAMVPIDRVRVKTLHGIPRAFFRADCDLSAHAQTALKNTR